MAVCVVVEVLYLVEPVFVKLLILADELLNASGLTFNTLNCLVAQQHLVTVALSSFHFGKQESGAIDLTLALCLISTACKAQRSRVLIGAQIHSEL